MWRLTIDPGAHTGYAIWKGSSLLRAGLINLKTVDSKQELENLFRFRDMPGVKTTVEIPIAYLGSRAKVNPNDLITLSYRAGYLGGPTAKTILPVTWKGNVPDKILYARIMKKLSKEERDTIPTLPKSVLHNTLDAVGIGLYLVRR